MIRTLESNGACWRLEYWRTRLWSPSILWVYCVQKNKVQNNHVLILLWVWLCYRDSIMTTNVITILLLTSPCIRPGTVHRKISPDPLPYQLWRWDDVLSTANQRRDPTLVCNRGHSDTSPRTYSPLVFNGENNWRSFVVLCYSSCRNILVDISNRME